MPDTAIACPESDPNLEALRQDWSRLNCYERGARLLPLTKDYSQRRLAGLFGCSPKLIRDCLELSHSAPGCGRKKTLACIRRRRAALGLSQRFRRGSVRRRLADQLTATMATWMCEEMPPAFWEAFFDEILNLPTTKEDYLRQKPRSWQECQIEEKYWKQIIAATKPARPPEQWDSLLGFWICWFARWYPRSMPLADIQERVFHRVRRKLRKLIPTSCWLD